MEREELEKLLESEEVQALLGEKYVAKTDIEKLEGKKNQILGEKKKVQEEVKTLKDTLAKYTGIVEKIGQMGYNPEDKLSEFVATLEIDTSKGDNPAKAITNPNLEDRLVVQQRTYESKIRTVQEEKEKRIKELENVLNSTVRGWDAEKIENALNHELDGIGVLPTHKNILKAAFKNLAEVAENEDGVRGVQLTTTDGLKVSAKEFFEAFAQSDEGKAYIAAPITTGGGALGGKGTRNTIDFTAERGNALRDGNTFQSVALALQEAGRKKR